MSESLLKLKFRSNEGIPTTGPSDAQATEPSEAPLATKPTEPTQAVYRPKAIQTVAALLMAIKPILVIIFPIIYINYMTDGFEANISERINHILLFFELLLSIGCALLISVACNKAVKVTAIGLTCLTFLEVCLFAAANNHTLQLDGSIGTIVSIIIQLVYVYLFALVINNSSLSTTSRNWINLICVVFAMVLVQNTYILWSGSFDKALAHSTLLPLDLFTFFPLFSYFMILLHLLLVVAYWKFARCEAFNGNYDKDYKCNFLPLNKWMAMAVIAPFITGVALYLYYMIIGITLE